MPPNVILCGLGRVGSRILAHIHGAGFPIVVISQNELTDPLPPGVTFIRGDCRRPDLLEQAGVRTARGVIIVTSDDLVNVSTAFLVRKLNPEVRVVVRMFNQNLINRLGAAVKNTVALSVSALTAPIIALTALTGDALGAFHLDDEPQQVAELKVIDGGKLIGRRIADVASRGKLLILGYTPASKPTELWPTISGTTTLQAGDTLVACGSPDDLTPLLSDGSADTLGGVRFASWFRRYLRPVVRTIATIDLPVKLAASGLFLTLFISTLVFRFGVGVDWADGFYQTVSIVGTGGELHAEKRDPWVKVFVSVLKISGAALLAGFTAILTQYLIRARLGGAFETRKIPDSGHIVVCGLGNVGFRCVEEFVRLEHPVVAIETIADSPFAATVRRMGVPVIIGDATVAAVLRQANVSTARAVIAATDAELVNLEIGLLVRDQDPDRRVVVRLTDPDFAEAAREAADIRLAVSVPALAAPVFAAALFGDLVQTLLTVGNRTLAIVELLVQPDDPCFADQSLLAAMIDYRFLPVGMHGRPPFARDGLPQVLRLQPGDKLTVVTELPNLEKLLRREVAPRVCRVVIEAYPLTAKDALVSLLRTSQSLSADDAPSQLQQLPIELATNLTRGEAEELVKLVARERVTASVQTIGKVIDQLQRMESRPLDAGSPPNGQPDHPRPDPAATPGVD